MNKKEMYRIEVQHNLKKLEMTCHDMASLLCGLGILVKSPYTTSHQVHAAYKRALLRFHSDRPCSVSDMRQQVEAEEKFKLISRMKEKVTYKQALVSFHPDRAWLGSDMHQQVEAEEKFKLSHMKEKVNNILSLNEASLS
ncbi:putative Chaperone J-domain superfamily [Helianthus annuus]|uniref:Chaperone J-domain superfamily n=1 Tax=Helianthus annuus TaxID=4232 RepID=A0A9K3H4B6_HELAN|nr:putative Chaperone J-domain superfamily [Helianthus annuus]KAJ0451009.1 putative Chaperone J-domain superfamily [Helianthus annuus]KAJ0455381.1 putative Chaperone J-domain superfamily [Helianthus annuus]KAJ0472870.1 putative Chaperone J-domain superfamily [Helianthus annuus]KAJ0648473.1 putative Chaperone J-domain superfamily [Helianthus annuus]